MRQCAAQYSCGTFSAMLKKLADVHADVAGNFAQENRRDVPPRMERYRSRSPVRMTVLLMRALLARLRKAETLQKGGDLTRLQDGDVSHLRPRS